MDQADTQSAEDHRMSWVNCSGTLIPNHHPEKLHEGPIDISGFVRIMTTVMSFVTVVVGLRLFVRLRLIKKGGVDDSKTPKMNARF